MRVLYLFAGKPRSGDIKDHLTKFQYHHGYKLEIDEFDWERSASHDLSKTKLWNEITNKVERGEYDVAMLSPPCGTFSRARHNRRNYGPHPVRSKDWPWGFPWLGQADAVKVDLANKFVKQCLKIADLQTKLNRFWLFEHPEDLGLTKSHEQPASVWQLQEMMDLIAAADAACWALHQCGFGAESSKPTRLASNLPDCIQFGRKLPWFDSQGRYLGPLGTCEHGWHPPLIGMANGDFLTTAAAAYPSDMCRYLAQLFISALVHSAEPAPRQGVQLVQPSAQVQDHAEPCIELSDDDDVEPREEANVDMAFQQDTGGCLGPPIKCTFENSMKEITDGLGLCSPGRWKPQARGTLSSKEQLEHAEQVRSIIFDLVKHEISDTRKASFQLALGHFTESPFTEPALNEARRRIASLVTDAETGLQVPDRQPFFLHLLAQSLRILGDPDWEVLTQGEESFAEGVPVGYKTALPRTPQVFRKREKFRTLDQTPFKAEMDNYFTAEMSSDALLEHFRQDEKIGRMIATTEAEARKLGDPLLIAAMGAVQKPDGRIRPLHDGTHGVNLNNNILILDRLEVPGPEEIIELTKCAAMSLESVFVICADISNAHRLVKIRSQDWPLLACRARSGDRTVWLNTVGTFGVSSASYWWARLFGCVGRWVLRIMGQAPWFQLSYVDDLQLLLTGSNKFVDLWIVIAAYEIMGTPFSFKKFRGGLAVDFIGYHIAYDQQSAGISQKRGLWIIGWIDQLEDDDWMTTGRSFIEFVGRMTFVSRILPWLKPFLAPLYAWSNVIGRSTVLKVPELVFVTLDFIRTQLQTRSFMVKALQPQQLPGERFRTDAKCAKGYVVLGGWSLEKGLDTKAAKWFSVKLEPEEFPWLFNEQGDSQWASTAAELLSSYVAAFAFGYLESEQQWQVGLNIKIVITGGTDNRANESIQLRNSTTKWPLLALHMQMSSSLLDAATRMRLKWRPREENVPADDLTNAIFDKFTEELRCEPDMNALPMGLFNRLVATREQFLQAKKHAAKTSDRGSATKKQKMADKTTW